MKHCRDFLLGLAALVACGVAAGGDVGADGTADHLLGQRMYREGVLPSGAPLAGLAQNETVRLGKDAACAACHRRSGFGTAEGSIVMRPIAGPDLYQTRSVNPASPRIAHQLGKPLRPAYDDTSLARAVRAGVDVSGRPLRNGMPRYALSDAEMRALTAYLKTLAVDAPPGVTDTEIHLATVIQPGVAEAKRHAMLGVLEGFVQEKNAGVRSEELRRKVGAMRMYRAYRKWVLHVWELEGPPGTWDEQLDKHYREEPVFALVAGLGAGSWQPIQAFSERLGLPCVLPLTDRPVTQADNAYTIYFSRGVSLEADALAKYLDKQHADGRIIQVYRPGTAGAEAADALRTALGGDARRLDDRPLTDQASPAFWRGLTNEPSTAVVLWLEPGDLAGASFPTRASGTPSVYLSATLLDGHVVGPGMNPVLLTYPWDVPATREPRLLRSRLWLRRHGLDSTEENVQAVAVNTLFAIAVAGDALAHMQDSFSRDYFVERVEHNVTTTLMPSFYPSVSLGPEQRYASKGIYIVRADSTPNRGFAVVSEWIVP